MVGRQHHRRPRDAEGGRVHPGRRWRSSTCCCSSTSRASAATGRCISMGRRRADTDNFQLPTSNPKTRLVEESSLGVGSWRLGVHADALFKGHRYAVRSQRLGLDVPVNTQAFEELAPKVKKMGFDLFEFGIESTSDLDYAPRRDDRQRQRARGQRLRGDGAGPRPDSRGRGHSPQRHGLRPRTASTRPDARREERRRTALQRRRPDLAADGGRAEARHRSARRPAEEAVGARRRQGRDALRRAAQPVRDELHEPGVSRRSRSSTASTIRRAAFCSTRST